eukprot:SAG11_NODE_31346_length_292_cov_1.549223_1_plen_43_part_10
MRLAWRSWGENAETDAGVGGPIRGSVALHDCSVASGGGREQED